MCHQSIHYQTYHTTLHAINFMLNASLHITSQGTGPAIGYLSSQLLPPLELDLIQELLQRTVGLPGRAHAAHSLFL